MKSFKSLFCASLLTLSISSATLAGNISGGAPSTISVSNAGNISGGAPSTISVCDAGNISGGAPSSISGLADELYTAILGLLLP